MGHAFLTDSVIAGLLASLACGVGALPLAFERLDLENRVGLGYGFAGGLMFSASVYNLILPGLTLGESTPDLNHVLLMLLGIVSGAAFLWAVAEGLTPERLTRLRLPGTRREILIFVAMAFHSVPEGVAVGVGYASSAHVTTAGDLGTYIAVAIGIHNVPEGLAVGIPMRAGGASIFRCFLFAFLSSLPQPIAAVPAGLLVWLFEPLMVPLLGFAAGAMIFLVLLELLPDALSSRHPTEIAWAFTLGFSLMVLVQAVL